MRTRRVFKDEKIKNKILQDCNGEELEFPDVEVNDSPQIGDKILIDGKVKETGERLMPDCTLIKFKEGKVTHIIPDTEETSDLKKATAVKSGACKTFSSWNKGKEQKVEILGNNEKTPFRIGNRIVVNGKNMKLAKIQMEEKEVSISNGRISAVKNLNEKVSGSRRVINPTGKKVIGKPAVKAQKEERHPQNNKPASSQYPDPKFKMIWMRDVK